ncbi:MAG: tetratricopeptide repeat protein [Akkermansiaceae bacterium]
MSCLQTAIFLSALALLASCQKDINSARLASTVTAGQSDARSIYTSAVAAEDAGKTKRARKLFEKVTKEYPLSTVAAEAQYRNARLLDQSGDFLDAFNAYDALISRYPNSPHYSTAIKREIDLAHAAAEGTLRTPTFIGLKTKLDPKKTVGMLEKVRDHAPRSKSAPKAQFTIGEVWQDSEKIERAIPAFQKVVSDFPESKLAPEAQYRIGELLLKEAEDGNQDQANLDRARRAFEDLLLRYPNDRHAREAKKQIAEIASGDIERTYRTAEFYRKKGQTPSALFYYQEVIRNSKPGPLHNEAKAWVAELSQ